MLFKCCSVPGSRWPFSWVAPRLLLWAQTAAVRWFCMLHASHGFDWQGGNTVRQPLLPLPTMPSVTRRCLPTQWVSDPLEKSVEVIYKIRKTEQPTNGPNHTPEQGPPFHPWSLVLAQQALDKLPNGGAPLRILCSAVHFCALTHLKGMWFDAPWYFTKESHYILWSYGDPMIIPLYVYVCMYINTYVYTYTYTYTYT